MPGFLFGTVLVACIALDLTAAPPEKPRQQGAPEIPAAERVSVEVARDRAKVMHDVYEATLDVMHHRYFHRERAVVPARAMEDVFSTIKRQSHVDAKWIAVNLKAMSVDHEPETDFEKKAATEIAGGKPDIEVIEDGYYRRAGAILLSGGCVGCHAGFSQDATLTTKYAALVISVPVTTNASTAK
ncbi:MAG TPA: DUF3365 domain-containing protein [Planctomycetaceae bacterium]|nr:DUF3365 domain-containing protein [Planctomycetaceae bacterium]